MTGDNLRFKSLANLVKDAIRKEERQEGFLGFEISLDKYGPKEDLRMTFFYLPRGETQVQNNRYEYKDRKRIK